VRWRSTLQNTQIVLVDPFSNGRLLLLDHQMNMIWGPFAIPTTGVPFSNGGPPTIADFDGDGGPEIGVAGDRHYVVFDGDGSILWQQPTQDLSSGFTGSAAFDFQGDGRAEVVYADETALRVYNGANGAVLFSTPHSSITGYELSVVADVDADGAARPVRWPPGPA
jgi:DNA-binding beta-propeller fold protein YncE